MTQLELSDAPAVQMVFNKKDFNRDNPMPMDYLYVGRPSIYGNPFSHLAHGSAQYRVKTRQESIEKYEGYARRRIAMDPKFREAILATRGRKLVCWCYPLACHAWTIIKLAEEIYLGLI